MQNSVDELEDAQLGFETTLAKMLNSQVVYVACFAWFRLGEENIVKLRDIHWWDLDLTFSSSKVKDVAIIQPAEIVEASVEDIGAFIGLSQMFCVSSKAFQDIITMVCPSRSVKNSCCLVGVLTMGFLHAVIDLVSVVRLEYMRWWFCFMS